MASKKMEAGEVARRVAELESWSERGGKLHREVRFESFRDAFAFMTRVAFEAETMNHHPDWSNSYSTVVVDLSSHDVGGISERDFRLAAAIDAAASVFGAR
ncbi:MAG TPA: 4a-hydroxytetrahydrobiopterin dehydratase [Thermoanaerobaculia bacterium]